MLRYNLLECFYVISLPDNNPPFLFKKLRPSSKMASFVFATVIISLSRSALAETNNSIFRNILPQKRKI